MTKSSTIAINQQNFGLYHRFFEKTDAFIYLLGPLIRQLLTSPRWSDGLDLVGVGRLHLLPLSSDLTTPNFPTLIWRSKFGPSSNNQFHVHFMVQIEFGCDPTAKIESQQLYDDPMVIFHLDFDPTAILAHFFFL